MLSLKLMLTRVLKLLPIDSCRLLLFSSHLYTSTLPEPLTNTYAGDNRLYGPEADAAPVWHKQGDNRLVGIPDDTIYIPR